MAISDKLTYLNTTKTLIKDNLNLGGANISNEPFRVYSSKLIDIYKDFLANGTDTLWNNWNKVSGTGENLTLNNTIKAKMKIDLKGNTSQEGTPTPDSPQDIHIVSGDNTVKVQNKNLFRINNYVKMGYNITIDNPLRGCVAGNYTISCQNDSTVDMAIIFSNEIDGAMIGGYFTGFNFGITLHTKTTNLTQEQLNAKYIVFQGNNNTIIQEVLENMQIMIEKSSTATEYEEHKEQTYPINLGSIELCKIGDYQDSIVKDNGKWYLKKEIGKVVLDGSESWEKSNSMTTGNYFGAYTSSKKWGGPEGIFINVNKFITNYFQSNNTTTGDYSFVSSSGYASYLKIDNSIVNSVEDLTTWLSTHNTEVYYVLATPTYEEITDSTLISQLEAIKLSYNEQTNISQENNDKPFILDVTALGELEI
jgi:hypothetical protein